MGSTVPREDVAISDGSFAVELDFGDHFYTSDDLWLKISVRPRRGSGADTYTTLTPL